MRHPLNHPVNSSMNDSSWDNVSGPVERVFSVPDLGPYVDFLVNAFEDLDCNITNIQIETAILQIAENHSFADGESGWARRQRRSLADLFDNNDDDRLKRGGELTSEEHNIEVMDNTKGTSPGNEQHGRQVSTSYEPSDTPWQFVTPPAGPYANLWSAGYAVVDFRVNARLLQSVDGVPTPLLLFFERYGFVASPTRIVSECPATDSILCPPGTHHAPNSTFTLHRDECWSCPPGTWCGMGARAPIECNPGSYAPGYNNTACHMCPKGMFQEYSGGAACEWCTRGHYCPQGSTAPVPCPPGTFNPYNSTSDPALACMLVPEGYYAPKGSYEPITCPHPPLFFCPGAAADTINEFPGSLPIPHGVQNCPAGQEKMNVFGGLSMCVDCRPGFFCIGGGASEKCPDNSWHNLTGVTNKSTCQACPSVGTVCATGYDVTVKQGFWMNAVHDEYAFRCAYEPVCAGGTMTFGDESCITGHMGVLCGGCITGYYRGRMTCYSCDEAGVGTYEKALLQTVAIGGSCAAIIAFFVIMYVEQPRCLVACGNCFCRAGKQRQTKDLISIIAGLFKVGLSFLQCLGAVSRFTMVKWPSIFLRFTQLVYEMIPDIFTILPAECVVQGRLGFYIELLTALLMPIGFSAATAIVTFCSRVLCSGCNQKKRDNSQGMQGSRAFSVHIFLFLCIYPLVMRKCFSIYDCIPAGMDKNYQEVFVIREDPVELCYTYEYWAWTAAASGGILAYCIVAPAFFFYRAYTFNRKYLRAPHDNERRRALLKVMLLVDSYKPGLAAPEALSLLHKAFFTGVIQMVLPDTRLQLWMGTCASILAFMYYLLVRPYRHYVCDLFHGATLLQILVTYVTAFLFFDDTDRFTMAEENDFIIGIVLVAANCTCFVVIFVFALRTAWRNQQKKSLLRYAHSGRPVRAAHFHWNLDNKHQPKPIKDVPLRFHIFLSHACTCARTESETNRLIRAIIHALSPSLANKHAIPRECAPTLLSVPCLDRGQRARHYAHDERAPDRTCSRRKIVSRYR